MKCVDCGTELKQKKGLHKVKLYYCRVCDKMFHKFNEADKHEERCIKVLKTLSTNHKKEIEELKRQVKQEVLSFNELVSIHKKETEELKELIKAYQRTYKTEHRLLCETVQKRDDYKHQLQTHLEQSSTALTRARDDVFKETPKLLISYKYMLANNNLFSKEQLLGHIRDRIKKWNYYKQKLEEHLKQKNKEQ